jgi:DNA polymerase-3 subunit gamma/tau
MSYLVLARKYRPQKFADVIGQEHITDVLAKAIESGKIAQAYLFCGPRGIGKTSCARILAKNLNCQKGPTLKPCEECPACQEITKGTSFDVLEIDGASNRGIDEIRTLRENVKFAPSYGRYKIYIVDEVHMLTTEAFNALLKTLEEPPAHVKFIFATTSPQKVPATIISRCQRFDFKRVSVKTIAELLSEIAKKEKLTIDQEALFAVAKSAQGSLRDSLSILDQVSALSQNDIKAADVFGMLGLVETQFLIDLGNAILQKNCVESLKILDALIEKGKDLRQLMKDLVEHFRHLMVLKVGGKSLGKLVDYPIAMKEILLAQAEKFALADILRTIDVLIEAQETARVTESYQMPLEIAFARLTYTENPSIATVKPAAAAVLPKPAPAPVSPAPTRGSSNILRNEKGHVSIDAEPAIPMKEPEAKASGGDQLLSEDFKIKDVSLQGIQQQWDKLTYAVSREKMSVATFLQEGFPVEFKDETLTIGFQPKFSFHKESLEAKPNLDLVSKVFAQRLGVLVRLQYKIISDVVKPSEDAAIKNIIETFNGQVVNRWHNA